MKLKWTQEHTAKTVSSLIVVVGAILFYFLFSHFGVVKSSVTKVISIISPFIYGFIISYILNRPMNFFENRVFKFCEKKKPRPKLKRHLSILTVFIIAFLIIGILFYIVIPQVSKSVVSIVNTLPDYLRTFQTWAEDILTKIHIDTESGLIDKLFVSSDEIIKNITSFAMNKLPAIFSFSKQFTSAILNIFVGIIISIYMLANKERFLAQIKKVIHAFLPEKFTYKLISIAHSSNERFNGFIIGKLLDSLIIGIICFIGSSLLNMPYAMLISVIIGVTNIIPFFGPFIGAIPSALIILIIEPIKALWFIIFIIILQQFDGNILGPKILGDSTGLSAFWVMFAILVGGGLFGFMGMFIGVPTFAVIFALVKEYITSRLEKKNLPTDTKEYASPEHQIKF